MSLAALLFEELVKEWFYSVYKDIMWVQVAILLMCLENIMIVDFCEEIFFN